MTEVAYAELLDSVNKVLDAVVDRTALQDFANGRSDLELRLWQQAGELGWLGVGLPEEQSGLGLGNQGLTNLHQALGAHLAPGPYLSSFSAWQTLSECADEALKAAVFSTPVLGAVCVPATPMASRYEGLHLKDGRVSGHIDHLLGSAWSPWALVPVQTESGGPVWAMVAIDGELAALTSQPMWDLTRGLCRLTCAGASATLLQQPFDGVANTLCAQLNLALAFDCVGAAAALLGETIEYMKGRSQFDRPIASFQALKHRVAKMRVELEMAQHAAAHALLMGDASEAERTMWAAMAKAQASDTYAWIAGECVQLHGGVGYTWEFNCHLHLKRARLNQALVGSSEQLLDRAASILAGPVPASGSFLEMAP